MPSIAKCYFVEKTHIFFFHPNKIALATACTARLLISHARF